MTNYLFVIEFVALLSVSGLGLRTLITRKLYKMPRRMASVSWN